MKSLCSMLALLMVLAACDAPTQNPTIRPAEGASAREAIESFVVVVGMAEGIARACGPAGIERNYENSRSVTTDYIRQLAANGYSGAELARISGSMDKKKLFGRADAYLQQRGFVKSRPQTLCPIGRSEMQKGTTLGKLLKSS